MADRYFKKNKLHFLSKLRFISISCDRKHQFKLLKFLTVLLTLADIVNIKNSIEIDNGKVDFQSADEINTFHIAKSIIHSLTVLL